MKLDVDLVIFDLDGTLLNTAPDIERCVNLAMKDYGLPAMSRERVLEIIGPGGRAFQDALVPDPKLKHKAEEIVQTYREYYTKSNTLLTRPYDGVVDVLNALRDTGVPMYVASNKPQVQCIQILQALKLDHYFRAIYGPEATPHPKPEPNVLHLIMEQTGAMPERTVMVGDTNNDMAAGHAAGVTTVFVSWGYIPESAIPPELIDVVIDTPAELLDLDIAELRRKRDAA